MYLDTGFEKFVCVHNLEVGCMLHFFYDDEGGMSVRLFNDSSCRMHYHDDDQL
jgi:hypothetical protein